MIVDPTDPEAGAIDDDGELLYPLYMVEAEDPLAPTVEEIQQARFVGYGKFSAEEEGGEGDAGDG